MLKVKDLEERLNAAIQKIRELDARIAKLESGSEVKVEYIIDKSSLH